MFEDVFDFDELFEKKNEGEDEIKSAAPDSDPMEEYSLFKNNTPSNEIWTTGKARDIWSTGGNDVWSTED